MTADPENKWVWLDASARRVLSETQLAPDPALVAEGWERRFVADRVRAREALELYAELGFDVRAEPIRAAEFDPECADCSVVAVLGFQAIYTRRRPGRLG